MRRTLLLLLLASSSSSFAADPPKLELKDGDRIVYLGNAFAERDANYGYFETLLTIAHPDISFTFRNLGWSGDTVWGDARARFGTRADGFQHLKDHVFALKPTVILVAYGMNESFTGEAGLPEFEKGLNTLLDTLAETKARIVVISPLLIANLGPPMPDPSKHNADLALYRNAIDRVAGSRGIFVVNDLDKALSRSSTSSREYTDDGILPNASGYARLATKLLDRLGILNAAWSIHFDERGDIVEANGCSVSDVTKMANGLKFRAAILRPGSFPTSRPVVFTTVMAARDLRPGKYRVLVDDVYVGQLAPVDQSVPDTYGLHSILIRTGPESDRMEALHAAINKKNELYFHRWRPQNETYLFGFRKHEQGNNAVEIPLFDPLVAEQEAEIARLKKPVKHTYELIREGDGK